MAARLFQDPDDEERLDRQFALERARRQSFAATATPELAQRTAAIRRQARTGGASLVFAKANKTPDDPLVQQAAAAAAMRKARKDSGFGVMDLVKGVSRVTMTAFETPFQELQAVVKGAGWGGVKTREEGDGLFVSGEYWRNVGEGISKAGRSTGWKALEAAAGGKDIDLGTGFFSGGEVRERQMRDSSRLQLNGKSITTGRVIADRIPVQEGTTPYNFLSGLIDASIAVAGDPANIAGAGITKSRQARRLFTTEADAAGLIRSSTRNSVIPERAAEWIDGKGRRVVEKLADISSPAEVRRLLGGKVTVDAAVEIANAPTPAAVRDVLLPRLGTEIREKPIEGILGTSLGPVGGLGTQFKRATSSIRLLQTMPGSVFRLDDPEQAVDQLERFLRNSRMDEGYITKRMDEMMTAADQADIYNIVIDGAFKDVMTKMTSTSVGRQRARQLTKAWSNQYQELTKYFIDDLAEEVSTKMVNVNGVDVALPTPHLFNELLNTTIPSPDARALRRGTAGHDWNPAGARWNKLVNSKSFDVGTTALDFMAQDVWKPLTLLRGAWTVRVVGEEQIRMAASGLDSLLSHPLRAISWVVGSEAKAGAGFVKRGAGNAARAVGLAGRGETDIFGNAFDDVAEFAASQSQKGGGWRDRIMAYGKTAYNPTDNPEEYVKGWRGELSQLANDPIARRVAGGWSPGDAVPSGLTGNHVADAKNWFWNGGGRSFRETMAKVSGRSDLLTDQAAADKHIDTVFRRISVKTGGDTNLMDAVARNKVDDLDLDGLVGTGVGPKFVKGDITLAGRPTTGSKMGEYLNTATDFMFTNLMSKPTNFLSRSPAFRQFYFQRLEELIPYMDDAAKRVAIDGAAEAGVSTKRMERMVGRGTGDLTAEEADLLAKGFGLDSTKKLLYDLSERSQASDIARIIFPFAEAWKEILTTWARIGTERPIAIRRLQQGVEGARAAGWFSTDPTTKQEMFNYPGTAFVMGKLTGMPAPLQGSVAGLNLFSNNPFVPGFGPVVQNTVGKLIPEKPGFDFLREWISPYGELDMEGGAVEAFLPAWFQKFRQSTGFLGRPDEGQWEKTVMAMSDYLVSTGEYDTTTVEEQERLSAAALTKARNMFFLRSMAQFVAPSAPTPKMMAVDKQGNLTTAFALAEEYRKLQDKENKGEIKSAVLSFLETFGEKNLLYMQPNSRGGFNPTEALHDWLRENGEMANRYPEVYGFFAPPDTEFSITELDRQIATGERERVRPDEALKMSAARVAGAKYRYAREQLGDRPNQAAKDWLRQYRDALVKEYPGWEPERFEMGDTQAAVRQLRNALNEPAVAETPQGQALAKYMSARDQLEQAAQAQGLSSFTQAKATAHYREFLRRLGGVLVDETPEFAPIFERVFEREMVDDSLEQEVVDG